ncbi:hypothetical protein ACTWP5_10655 [Streptomyces sp. 4N509B]|uniref:hypothetical protein n=1 Tax=Streptomyces sp. 4N509B TaxID=3457413 RepID=UPI003FD1AFF6
MAADPTATGTGPSGSTDGPTNRPSLAGEDEADDLTRRVDELNARIDEHLALLDRLARGETA